MDPAASIALSDDTLEPGAELTITGRNFKPGSTASFTLFSEPVLLGTAVADAAGVVTLRVTLPQDVAAGAHTIVISGVGMDGAAVDVSAAIAIAALAASDGGLATTGASAKVLGGLAIALLMAGASVFVMNRRRAASH